MRRLAPLLLAFVFLAIFLISSIIGAWEIWNWPKEFPAVISTPQPGNEIPAQARCSDGAGREPSLDQCLAPLLCGHEPLRDLKASNAFSGSFTHPGVDERVLVASYRCGPQGIPRWAWALLQRLESGWKRIGFQDSSPMGQCETLRHAQRDHLICENAFRAGDENRRYIMLATFHPDGSRQTEQLLEATVEPHGSPCAPSESFTWKIAGEKLVVLLTRKEAPLKEISECPARKEFKAEEKRVFQWNGATLSPEPSASTRD